MNFSIKTFSLQLFEIKEAKPLHQNFIFWAAIFLPILGSMLLAYPLIKSLAFDFTFNGYREFLRIFNFPIWIASSSLVFGIMVGRFHGSAQRAATLKATREQNNFSNYLNHRDHFQKYMQNVADEFDIKVDAFKMYGILFSKSTPELVHIKLSDDISEYILKKFESKFWEKMRFAGETKSFSVQEVNIYFPRFAREIGINAEKIEIKNYQSLKETLVKIRKIYGRAMEYGFTRSSQPSNIEVEELGISTLIGEFDEWSNANGFKSNWHDNKGYF